MLLQTDPELRLSENTSCACVAKGHLQTLSSELQFEVQCQLHFYCSITVPNYLGQSPTYIMYPGTDQRQRLI